MSKEEREVSLEYIGVSLGLGGLLEVEVRREGMGTYDGRAPEVAVLRD